MATTTTTKTNITTDVPAPPEDVIEAVDYEYEDHHGPTAKHQVQQKAAQNGKAAPAGQHHKARHHHVGRRRSSVVAPNDVSFHPGSFVFFAPPEQRQRWGDTQVLPRVNWGDLFFDLFYVASAYNTSNILVDSPTGKGALYFLGTFFPVFGFWLDKAYFDARFAVGNDLYHRFYEVVVMVVLAIAVLHIRTVDIMSHPSTEEAMFAFCLALFLGRVLTMIRYLEVFFFGIGQDTIRRVALWAIRSVSLSAAMYLAATVVAALAFYGDNNDDKPGRMLAGGDEGKAEDYLGNTNNIPIYLILFGVVLDFVNLIITVVFCFPGGGKHKQFTVPMNIDFFLHRNGQWTMLMLGESILSILIIDVEQENNDYFATFYCSILVVVLLQYLHFRSQPHDADEHALRLNKNRGVAWNFLQQFYSAALVALGAAFTLFLVEFSFTDEYDEEGKKMRLLAAVGGGSDVPPEERKQRAANLFSASLAAVWFSLDAMILSHVGFVKGASRCRQCPNDPASNWNVKGILLIICRMGLIVFVATLSRYETDPQTLALLGLVGVIMQMFLRKLGGMFFPEHHDGGGSSHHNDETGEDPTGDDDKQGNKQQG